MDYYIGIDLGGTNVRIGKLDENLNVCEEYVEKSYGLIGPKELVRDTIFSLIDKIENLEQCKGIGVAVPGPIDKENRVMTISHNIVGFKDYPIAKIIEDRYHKPVYLENDANVAGLAEAIVGAGKGKEIVYYITHSTGIGGALVINGKLINGLSGSAGEVGNIVVKDDCIEYKEGLNAGSIEGEYSGSALARKAKALYGQENTILLFDKAKEGDNKAQMIIDEMAINMGKILAIVSQVVDPDVFVFGGGVIKNSDYYWPKMIETYHQYFNGFKYAEIVKAKINEPGVLGAALLVKEG